MKYYLTYDDVTKEVLGLQETDRSLARPPTGQTSVELRQDEHAAIEMNCRSKLGYVDGKIETRAAPVFPAGS